MNNLLKSNVQPGPTDVLIGRGKRCYNHSGNINLNNVVASKLDEYSCANTKQDKSNILADVVDKIQESSSNGRFLKLDTATGLWIIVSDIVAREKTSQAFRDALKGKYKSSNSNKKKQKKQQREMKRSNKCVATEYNVDAVPSQLMKQQEKSQGDSDMLDHFASSLHSFDMDMDLTVLEGTNHASIVSLEDIDELSFSSGSCSSSLEFEDEFSDSSFDDQVDELYLDQHSLLESNEDMSNTVSSHHHMHCIPFYTKEHAIDINYQKYAPIFNKHSMAHNNTSYKSMYSASHEDSRGFGALPVRNISTAMTA